MMIRTCRAVRNETDCVVTAVKGDFWFVFSDLHTIAWPFVQKENEMEADKFSTYVIEIAKSFVLINGGAMIAVATLIGNMYDTKDPQYEGLLRIMVAKSEYILG